MIANGVRVLSRNLPGAGIVSEVLRAFKKLAVDGLRNLRSSGCGNDVRYIAGAGKKRKAGRV